MSELRTFSPANSNFKFEELNIRNTSLNVAVIGAGVMGAWTALQCLRKGCSVRLFDKWGPGNSRSSSGGESRLVRAIYGEGLAYTQLTYESISSWKELEATCGTRLFYQTGIHWFLPEDLPKLYEPTRQFLPDSYGIETLEPGRFARKFPFINIDDISTILMEENAGYILARDAIKSIVRVFIEEGGEYIQEEIQVAEQKDLTRLYNAGGHEIEADMKYLSTGPWLKNLLPQLCREMEISRQEVHYYTYRNMKLPFTPWIDYNPGAMFYGVWDHDHRGIKVAHDARGPVIHPDEDNRIPSVSELTASDEYMQHRFPGLGKGSISETRVCQYSNTADGNIIIDKHPSDDSLIILGGGSGHAFKMGPAIGRLAYEIGSGQRQVPKFFSLNKE